MKIDKILRFVSIIMVLIAVVFIFLSFSNKKDNSAVLDVDETTNKGSITIIKDNLSDSTELKEEIIKESVGKTEDHEGNLISLYDRFKSINEDVVAYLRIRNSNLIFPIVQSKVFCSTHRMIDNCYYLYRNIYKESAVNETAIQFMEANNNVGKKIEDFDQNTIIFGHTWSNNEKNGKTRRIGDENDMQFDQLVSYTDMGWLNEHKVVELTTGEEITYWIPQFVVYTDCSKTDYPQGFNYGKRTLNSDDIKLLKDRSVIINSNDVTEEDKLLLFSTCNYKYGSEKYNRFLVVFKNIEASDYFDALDIANQNVYLNHENIVNW